MSVVNNSEKNQLKKVLGLGFGIAIVIGGTIGVGILRTPGTIAAQLPNIWLILLCWLVGGIYMFISAISYAELAAMMPKAGGMYNYVKTAFGNYFGFIVGWFDYIVNAMAPAYYSIVISEYLLLLFPNIPLSKTIMGLVILSSFVGLNLLGTRTGSIFQQITSVIKVLFFLFLIIACFGWGSASVNPAEVVTHLGEPKSLLLPFFIALQFITGAYNGWWNAAVFAEEDTDPGKNLPRSFFIGTLIIIAIYLLINAALFYVVPVDQAANNPLVASQAAELVFGKAGFIIMVLFALFSLINILNAYMMIPARILFGLGRDGLFLKRATVVNSGGSPVFALIFSFILQAILVVISSFDQLFALGSFLGVLILGLTFYSVIFLRKKYPDMKRPYKAWAYPWTTIIALISTFALIIFFSINDFKSLVISIVLILISIPAFKLVRRGNQ